MALTVTPAKVAILDDDLCNRRSHIAAAAINAGQAVYQDATGRVNLASALTAGAQQFRGIALETVGPGQAVDVCYEGPIVGVDLAGVAYDGLVYLTDAAGGLDLAASATTGAKPVVVGRVIALADAALTKCLHIRVNMSANW